MRKCERGKKREKEKERNESREAVDKGTVLWYEGQSARVLPSKYMRDREYAKEEWRKTKRGSR